MGRQAHDRGGQGAGSSSASGAKTKRVVGKRNVIEKFDGKALRKTGEGRQTVDHPMALFALKNVDGSPLFPVADRRKGKKAKKGKQKQPRRKK